MSWNPTGDSSETEQKSKPSSHPLGEDDNGGGFALAPKTQDLPV